MRKLLAVLAMSVTLLGLAATPVSAATISDSASITVAKPDEVSANVRAVPTGCQFRSVNQAPPNPWLYFNTQFKFHYTGTFRVAKGCGNDIVWRSDGWRHEGAACGQLWVRLITSVETVLDPVHVCGGDTVVLARDVPSNTRFQWEGWRDDRSKRVRDLWFIGQLQF